MPRSGADKDVLHQPAILVVAGLEAWLGPEVDQLGIDGLAALELLQQIDRSEANAAVLDIDGRAIIRFQGVFRLQVDQLVGADDLEVGAQIANPAADALAAQARALHLAAMDRDDPAHADAGLASA